MIMGVNFYEDALWFLFSGIWVFSVFMYWRIHKEDTIIDKSESKIIRNLFVIIALTPICVNAIVVLLKVCLILGFID